MLFTRNSKVQAMIAQLRREHAAIIQHIREEHAEEIQALSDRVQQLWRNLSIATVFVGGGTLDAQLEKFEQEQEVNLVTATQARELAQQLLNTAKALEEKAEEIGTVIEVGRAMSANQTNLITFQIPANVATALELMREEEKDEE